MPRRRRDSSPLDASQRELLEAQEKLRREMEDLQRVIENAPKAAEQAKRRQQEEIIARARQSATRFESPARIADRRFDAHTVVATRGGGRRTLKREQSEQRLKFIALCVVLLLIVAFLYVKLSH